MKTTSDLVDDIVEQLHDAACEGDVAEVFVLFRTRSGEWHAGWAARDAHELAMAGHAVLDQIETMPPGVTKH